MKKPRIKKDVIVHQKRHQGKMDNASLSNQARGVTPAAA
jgi:hypothetical protein